MDTTSTSPKAPLILKNPHQYHCFGGDEEDAAEVVVIKEGKEQHRMQGFDEDHYVIHIKESVSLSCGF